MRGLRFLIALVGSFVLLTWPVLADTVSIGLQEGGSISTVGTGIGTANSNGAFGTFSNIHVSGVGQSVLTPNDILFADNIDTATSAGGTLNVFITDQGLTAPLGTLPFTSSFTANVLPPGWTITESTFVSNTNALYSGTPLSATTLPSIGTSVQTASAATGSGLYSVTEEFTIRATGAGDANNTIDLSVAAAEPSLALGLGLGFIGLGFMLNRRRNCA